MLGVLVLRILMALMVFDICTKVFSFKYNVSALTVLACEMGSLNPDDGMALSAMTEVPFAFINVIAAWLFLKCSKSNGKKKHFISAQCVFL